MAIPLSQSMLVGGCVAAALFPVFVLVWLLLQGVLFEHIVRWEKRHMHWPYEANRLARRVKIITALFTLLSIAMSVIFFVGFGTGVFFLMKDFSDASKWAIRPNDLSPRFVEQYWGWLLVTFALLQAWMCIMNIVVVVTCGQRQLHKIARKLSSRHSHGTSSRKLSPRKSRGRLQVPRVTISHVT